MVIEDHIHIDGQMTLTDRLMSTVTGIAPLIVASSVLVGNLNADMLDGYHASEFARLSDTYTKDESNSRYVGLEFNSNGVAEQSSGNVSIDAQHGNKIVYSDFWTGIVPDGLFSNSGFLRISESDWYGHQEFMGYGDAWYFRSKEFEGNWNWSWYQLATRQYTDDTYYSKAASDLRYAAKVHTHAASEITSGTFAIGRIPTGNTSNTVSLGNHTHAVLTRGTGLTGSNYNGGVGTTWAVEFGSTSGTVAQGNDSRIINGQTAFSWGNHALAGYALSSHVHSADDITSGVLGIGRIPTGITSTTVALGNHTHAFSSITGKPTTIAGYGITDTYTQTQIDSLFAPITHTHSFASLTGKPTTVSGYGITDVLSNTTSITINGSEKLLSTNPVFNVGTLTSIGITMPTGFSVSNTPITGSSGTLNVGFAAGYSLPTNAKQAEWDEAYSYSQAGHLPITNVSTGGLIESVTGSANRNVSGILYGTWDSGTPSDTSNTGTLFTMMPNGGFLGSQLYFALGDSLYFRSSVSGTWLGWNKFASTSWVNSQGFLTNSDVWGIYQPLDPDLTDIAALSGTSGFLKKVAANTWELDTNSYSLSSHTHTFASLTSKPTTITGYGITDAFTQTLADARYSLLGHNHAVLTAGTGLNSATYNGSTAVTFSLNFGTTAGTVAQGNDSRILNGQTAFSWGNHSLAGYLTSASLTNYVQKWQTWESKFDQGAARPAGMVNNGMYILGSGVNQTISTFHSSFGRAAGLVFSAYQAAETGNVLATGTFKSHGPGTDSNRQGGVFSFTSNGGHFIWAISELYSGLAGENSDLTMVEAMRLNASGLSTTVNATFPNIYSKTEVDTLLVGYSSTSHTHSFASLTGKPTTLSGYGITDAFTESQADAKYSLIGHTHAFTSLTGIPTTVAGYGITDTYTKVESDDRYLANAASNIGWDAVIGAKSRLVFSSTDGPSGVAVWHGMWIAQTASYGTAIAFRNGSMSIRSVENGVIGNWIPIANQNWATPNTRTIIAGNGLTGGGNLTEDRTLTLGTPGAITLSSANTVTGTSHTHAFTPGGTTSQYIRGDGSLAAFPAIPAGTVTSVGMSVPAGFAVSPASITTSGTFAMSFASGYSLPTTAKQTQWDSAYNYSQVGHIVDNNDAWKFRGTFNAVDANTLILPGWYDNGAASPTTTNIPVSKAGFINVTPFKTSSFVGGVQEYTTAGSADSNSNRRFWRSYWAGTFYNWREYAAVDWVESQGFAKLPINSRDWTLLDTSPTGSQLSLNTSTVNSPSGSAWHGLWIPHNTTGTYGTNIAFRNNAASIRSKENGVWQLWNPLITQSILNGRVLTINGTGYNLGSSQVINVGDVNSSGTKTDGALTMWNASGQLVNSSIVVSGNTYTLGPANSTAKTIKFNYGSNEVGFQISNWSSAAAIGPHAAIYTGAVGGSDGYGRLALISRPTDDSNGRIDFRVGADRKIGMWVNWNGDVSTPYRFISTVATGTSPFQVASQTVIANLNADLLDGLHATDFLQVASANAFVYRANWGGMDANTMYTQSGWWANNDASPSGSNFPINQAGIFEFIRNPLGSNSGAQEHTILGGATANRGRKFWRTVHGGAFTAWQEYLSAEKAALTYITIANADNKYGIRNENNIWNGSVNHFAPTAFNGLYSVNNSISIFRRTGPDEGTAARGIDKDGIEAWRLRNNDATTPKSNIQLSLENGQISVPGGNSNEWNTAYSVVQNLSANVAPPRFRPVGVTYIPKNESFSEDIDLSQLLISTDNLADLRILHIDNAFYSDKGIAAMNSGVAGDLIVHLSGSINISVPENYNPIEVIVENTTNGRQTHVPLRVATIEYTNVIPSWMAKIGITYLLSSHESTIHFDTSRDVESRILAQGGTHPSGLDHDSQPWNSMVWNPGTTEWVAPGYTELGRYNPTPAQMGTGGLQPDTNYTLEFREPTNPLIIYRVPFKTPNANVITTPQSILGGGSLPACPVGPDLMSVSNVTQTGLTFQFDGVGVTQIKWRIKSGASVVREGTSNPSSSIVNISFDLLQPGNYLFEIEGGSCSSPVDSQSFTITGGQATGFYLQLFRDGVQVNSQWNGGSMPVPANHFNVKFIRPSSPNYGAITYFWEVKINNTWQTAIFYKQHADTSGHIGGGFTASLIGDQLLVPMMDDTVTPMNKYTGLTSDSGFMNPKRLVSDPAEFRLVIQVRSGNESSPITETKYYNLQLATSGGGVPVEAGYNEQVITSPNGDWKGTFTTGRKTQWSINNNGEITDNYPDNYNGATRRLMVDGVWQNVHYMVNMHWYDNIINLKLPEGNFSITKLYAPEDITKESINTNTAILEARLAQDADHLTEIKIEQVNTGIGLE